MTVMILSASGLSGLSVANTLPLHDQWLAPADLPLVKKAKMRDLDRAGLALLERHARTAVSLSLAGGKCWILSYGNPALHIVDPRARPGQVILDYYCNARAREHSSEQ